MNCLLPMQFPAVDNDSLQAFLPTHVILFVEFNSFHFISIITIANWQVRCQYYLQLS